MALTTDIRAQVRATLTTELSFSTVTNKYILDLAASLEAADTAWGANRPVGAHATDTIDLLGTIPDGAGGTFAIQKIYVLAVRNNAALYPIWVEGTIGGTEYGFHSIQDFQVGAGGWEIKYNPAGWSVTNGVNDLLSVYNESPTAADYDILLVGKLA